MTLPCYAGDTDSNNGLLATVKSGLQKTTQFFQHRFVEDANHKPKLMADNTQPANTDNTQQTNAGGAQPTNTVNNSTYVEQSPEILAAMQAMSQDDFKTAAKLYEQYLQKNPNSKPATIGLARAQLLLGNYADAEKLLAAYKEKFGEDDAYSTEKARDLALNDHPQEALAILEPLLKKDPTNDTLLDIKQFALSHPANQSTPSNNQTMAATPEQVEQNSELSAADQAANNNNYKKAIELYQQYLKKNPDDKTAILGLARVKMLEGKNYSDAKKILTDYKNKFGEDDAYSTENARYFALTDQPKQALAILQPLLKKDPTNDTLLTIKKYALTHKKQISKEGQGGPSAEKLASLAESNGSNPQLYADAAKAYFDAGNSKQALSMINKALQINCYNGEYLLLKAKIATDLNDSKTAYQIYKRLYITNCNNPVIILGYARAANSANKLDKSARLYWIYISRYPNERKPWLEYAYVQSWRGNDRMAIWTLDEYHARFGDSTDYLIERARIVAGANRPTPALDIIHSLWPTQAKNYDLNYANTVALYYNNQPIEMFASLARVNQLQPKSVETNGLNDFIRTPFRSNVSLDGYGSTDSDTVKISHATLAGQYFVSPLTFILSSLSVERLSASIGSGLAPVEGGHALELYRFNIGVNHRFNPHLALQGVIGDGSATDGENAFIYEGDAFIKPTDTTEVDLQLKRDFYDQSARAVSRGVKQNLHQLQFSWLPCIQCFLNINTSFSNFTDGNRMTYEDITPAINLIATERFNLRLGAEGTWYQFSKRLSNGYYSPLNYRFYGGVADLYLKQSDDIGFEFSVGLGTQKDETFTTFKPADDYSAKAYFGIYRDWYLVFSGATSTRGRSIATVPSTGTYRVYAVDAMLTRRF